MVFFIIITAGSIIMASDKNNQYLVTGDVDGVIKVWEILEYATHSVSEPITTTPRKYAIIFPLGIKCFIIYLRKILLSASTVD